MSRDFSNAVVAEGLSSLPAGGLEKYPVNTQALRGLAEAGTLDFPLVFCGGTRLFTIHGLIQHTTARIIEACVCQCAKA